jgi:RNA polymerase sigma-70 factor, ECF subfamily
VEERQLIDGAQHGDLDSFQLLVAQHANTIWRTIRVLVDDPALAEDIVQESWVEAWKRLPGFDGGCSFRRWLLAIIAHRSRHPIRREAYPAIDSDQKLYLTGEQEQKDPPFFTSNPNLGAILTSLPIEQRCALKLHCYAGLAPDEIALVLRLPAGTVTSQLHRALNDVRAHLKENRATRKLLEHYSERKHE